MVFTGSKFKEDPQRFIDEMVMIFRVKHTYDLKGVEYTIYQLKDMVFQ